MLKSSLISSSFSSFFSFIFLACLGCFLCVGPSLYAQALLDEARLSAIVQRQAAALVRVKSSTDQIPEDTSKDVSVHAKAAEKEKSEPKTLLRLGTGFFISSSGLLLTNASVVDGAKRLWYEVDGVPYLAELRGVDVPTNTALLQAKTMPKAFSVVNLADNVTLPPVGGFLVRLSLPLEFPATPTLGMVQGADTQFGPRAFPTRYLRVQMGTGPGEAGAPVFDLQGRFVGMNVAVLPELGATYVLPARALGWVREGLASGAHTYSYFGFNAADEASPSGTLELIVKNVEAHGPAQLAGLRVGDRILEAGKTRIENISDLRDAAFFTKPGQYLDLMARRGAKDTAFSIQAAPKMPSDNKESK